MIWTREQRADILRGFGAFGAIHEELLAYNENHFDHGYFQQFQRFPLPDELSAQAWAGYADESQRIGVLACLKKHLPQLHFPIREGISQEEDYRAATRRGHPIETLSAATGLELIRPDALELALHMTPAGRIPLLIVPERRDFVALVQALATRNEPQNIPDSMGACMVVGLNNWGRIRQIRAEWETTQPTDRRDDLAWQIEFKRLMPHKERYQDRFILLSDIPYSGVSADELGLTTEAWQAKSLILRREHESAHYCTKRLLNFMQNNALDEFIADYMGIVTVRGYFDSAWFLRFMGLENHPNYRQGGRLQNYRGEPPLSDAAFGILAEMVVAAARNLEAFDREFHATNPRDNPTMLLTLTQLTLEVLAAPTATETLWRSIG